MKNREEMKYMKLMISAFLSFLVGRIVTSLPENLIGILTTTLLLATQVVIIILSCQTS